MRDFFDGGTEILPAQPFNKPEGHLYEREEGDAVKEDIMSFKMGKDFMDVGGELRLALNQDWNISDHSMKVLEGNFCESLLPMAFLRKGSETIVYYSLSNYLPLDEYLNRWKGVPSEFSGEVVRILTLLTKGLLEAESWLLPLDLFSLNPRTIFVNKKTGQVKLAFCRFEFQGEGIRGRMVELLKHLEDKHSDSSWMVCSNGLRRELSENAMGLSEMSAFFKDQERQVNRQQVDDIEHGKVYDYMWGEKEKTKEKKGLSWLLRKG
ncbi:MAG: DUF6382 domain-containing protein [Anaerovoracaceae bacterium]|jgi:hypothetical protein